MIKLNANIKKRNIFPNYNFPPNFILKALIIRYKKEITINRYFSSVCFPDILY